MKANQWIKPFSFTLLILVVPLLGYYIYFVEAREAFLLDRYHAHLASIAAYAEARVSLAFNIVEHNFGNSNDLDIEPLDPRSESGTSTDCLQNPSASVNSTEESGTDCVSSLETNPSDRLENVGGGTLRVHKGSDVAVADANILFDNVDPERNFYDVVILDEENRVVFQRRFEQGRIAGSQLVPGKQQQSGSTENESESTVDDPLADMRVTYQGRNLFAFNAPLVVPVAPESPTWKIVGLLEQSQFNRLKYDVRPSGIVTIGLVVLTLLFAGPFLKLWYLGRFEPLTRFDIFIQAAAGLSLVAMLTVGLLGWMTWARLSAYFDERLNSIATELSENIETEFGHAVDALYALEPMMIDAYRIRPGTDISFTDRRGCPTLAAPYASQPALDVGQGPTVAGDLLKKMGSKTAPPLTKIYPQLIMAYLMDQRGCQLVKWSSERQWPEPGQFEDRRYFQRALWNEQVPLRLYDPDGKSFFQDVVFSRTTGERQIVFSKPVRDCTEAPQSEQNESVLRVPCVSVITGTLRALDSVLPYGYSAMLLDSDLNIVLRNSADRSTATNVANEINEIDRLRAIVEVSIENNTEWEQPFDADFNASPHRLRVVPIRVGNLVLVAFYNRNLIATTVLEAVGAAGTAWLVWVSIVVVLFSVAWIADDITGRALRRREACIAIALTALGFVGWFALQSPLILPLLVAISVVAFALRYRPSATVRRTMVFVATCVLVTAIGVVPMANYYRNAEEQTLAALARIQIHRYRDAARQQELAFDDWRHEAGLANDLAWSGFSTVKNFSFIPMMRAIDERVSECGLDIVCLVLQNVPDYTADIAGVHTIYDSGRLNEYALGSIRRALLGGTSDLLWYYFIAFVFFIALTLVAIWYLLVRTFGLRAENVVEVSSFKMPAVDEKAYYILYGVPAQDKKRQYFDVFPPDKRCWIDLRDQTVDTKFLISTSAEVVVIDYFDVNLVDIEIVRKRVELLEQLLREGRRVILLFVGTDTLNFVLSTYNVEKEAALISRLATALSRFKLTYHRSPRAKKRQTPASPIAPASLRNRLQKKLAQWFEITEWRQKLVERECRHPELWEIRDDLLNEPELKNWSKGQIVQQVHSRANAIYQRLWNQCTRVEKFTLIELAKGHPINPNNWDAARRLRLRGFVRTDPFYRIASASLRQFVNRLAEIENVRSWHAESPGAWNQIKIPLLVLLIGTLVFFGLTQPDLFNSLFAFLAAGAASFPLLASVLTSHFKRSEK